MANDYKTYTDSKLVRLIGEDNEPALRELFDRYWVLLFQRANNFLDNEDTAKDCVQEIFIRLWQRRNSLDIENVDHYLHQAVRFQDLSVLRKMKGVAGFESRVAQFAEKVRNSNELEFRELKAFLEGLIESLPEDQRLIFRLHREESLTYREIAVKLHISVKTVEKKMSMSLRYLRAHAGDGFVLLCVICGLQ